MKNKHFFLIFVKFSPLHTFSFRVQGLERKPCEWMSVRTVIIPCVSMKLPSHANWVSVATVQLLQVGHKKWLANTTKWPPLEAITWHALPWWSRGEKRWEGVKRIEAVAPSKYCHRFFRQKRINRWYVEIPRCGQRRVIKGKGEEQGETHWKRAWNPLNKQTDGSWFLINYKSALWPDNDCPLTGRGKGRRGSGSGHALLLFDFWRRKMLTSVAFFCAGRINKRSPA